MTSVAVPLHTLESAALPHYGALVRRLALIVGDIDEAQDLAQATMLRAHENWVRLEGADVRAWVFTVGIRLALNERRRRLRWRAHGAQTTAVAMDVDPDLWTALGDLPRPQRIALVLNVLDGYTQAEIAEQLEVPVGTVASWIARAKHRLRQRLETRSGGQEHGTF